MPLPRSHNSLNTLDALVVGTQTYTYFSLKAAETELGKLSHLPYCLRLLMENLLRHENGSTVTVEDMRSLASFHALQKKALPLRLHPSRLLANDETGLSILADLAALMEAAQAQTKKPASLSLPCPLAIVIDTPQLPLEDEKDRISLLKWGQEAIADLTLVSPGHGHAAQTAMDALSSVVMVQKDSANQTLIAVPEVLFAACPHVAGLGGLSQLGWAVDALEIEGVLLEQTAPFILQGVVGVQLSGDKEANISATDIGLAVAEALSQINAKGKFIEFYGAALDKLTVPERAVISTIVCAYGPRACLFPTDAQTLAHLTLTGTNAQHVALVEAYAKAQGLWREAGEEGHSEIKYSSKQEIALDSLRPFIASQGKSKTMSHLHDAATTFSNQHPAPGAEGQTSSKHGDVVFAHIAGPRSLTCLPDLITAGLMARKAVSLGLKVKPWVQALLQPSDPVALAILEQSGLRADFEKLGFVCTPNETSLGNTVLPKHAAHAEAVAAHKITLCSLSCDGEADESLKQPYVGAAFTAPAPLVFAYAIAGTFQTDLTINPIAMDSTGKPVLLKELLPSAEEVLALQTTTGAGTFYQNNRQTLSESPAAWKDISVNGADAYVWPSESNFVKRPTYPNLSTQRPANIHDARILLLLGDDVRSDDMAPTGIIKKTDAAGYYLSARGVEEKAFYSFAKRTGNHEVMMRGAFAGNLTNAMLPPDCLQPNGMTLYAPDKSILRLLDAAERYAKTQTPLVVVAGQNFGLGQRQEWAAKSLALMGVRTVVAESYAPSFKINLIRCGILPLQLKAGVSLEDLKLTGLEILHFAGIPDIAPPRSEVMLTIEHYDGVERYMVLAGIETAEEQIMFMNGSMFAVSLQELIALGG